MDRKNLWKKLEQERKLSDEEWEALKKQSDPKAQALISLYVRSIYEEQPSPTWQRKLTERLNQTKTPPLTLRHTLSIATAGALALLMWLLIQPRPNTISKEELANQLLQWHEEAKVVTFLPPDSKDLTSIPSKMSNPRQNQLEELIYGDYLKEL